MVGIISRNHEKLLHLFGVMIHLNIKKISSRTTRTPEYLKVSAACKGLSEFVD